MSKYKSFKKNFREDALILADAIYNLKLKNNIGENREDNNEDKKDDPNKENKEIEIEKDKEKEKEIEVNREVKRELNKKQKDREEMLLDLMANFLRKHDRTTIHLNHKKRFNTLI
jgi:predicted ATP-dependent protease